MGTAPQKPQPAKDVKLVGIRINPKTQKLMKAVADLHNMPVGELLEHVFYEALEGRSFFAPGGKVPAKQKGSYANLKAAFDVEKLNV